MNDPYGASFASAVWKKETGDTLRQFLRYMEASPLISRIMGYHVSGMHTGEWHYLGCRWLPDYSAPMQKVAVLVPVELLRWIAERAGVRMWSSREDNVQATAGAAMICAADEGERVLRLPRPMAPAEGGPAASEHRLSMQFGEVRLFVKP